MSICEYCHRGMGHNKGCPNYEEEKFCDLCGHKIYDGDTYYTTVEGTIMCDMCGSFHEDEKGEDDEL